MENTTQDKQPRDIKILLGLSITSLIVSILPVSLINTAVALVLLALNVACLSLTFTTIVAFRKARKSVSGAQVASLVLNIIAIASVLFYLFLSLVIAPAASEAATSVACSMQTNNCETE